MGVMDGWRDACGRVGLKCRVGLLACLLAYF
jgi:hypothetical protein